MLKFDEEKQIASVQGALALRGRSEAIVDDICRAGFKNICWLGIGGTYASCLQAEVHMKERSTLEFFVENAAEYLTTGNRRVGEGTVVVISSVTGSTIEMVDAVKKGTGRRGQGAGLHRRGDHGACQADGLGDRLSRQRTAQILHGGRPPDVPPRRVS